MIIPDINPLLYAERCLFGISAPPVARSLRPTSRWFVHNENWHAPRQSLLSLLGQSAPLAHGILQTIPTLGSVTQRPSSKPGSPQSVFVAHDCRPSAKNPAHVV